MRLRTLTVCFAVSVGILAQVPGVLAHVAPATGDTEMPPAMRRVLDRDPTAFTYERAWIGVADRARATRRVSAQLTDAHARLFGGAVAGHFEVPVFAVSFAGFDSVAYAAEDLEHSLFDDTQGTLRDFYREISGGRVTVTGQVRGWHTLAQEDSYYEGTSNGLDPNDARVGELIENTLDAYDSGVDFGLYDNDGPDGIPNSGDDDGYVDFVAFVHPEVGGECGPSSGNIWSHRWRYTSWPASGGIPYQTNDVSASGGVILVNDYVIQPGLACGGDEPIEIGVFCHEFGHAFGLPDLYDTNGGGAAGLGHWCLMASGNWNTPDSPAHMSAWTKSELGWTDIVDVTWQGTVIDVDPVEAGGQVYRLSFRDERWRRRDDCAISGDYSMAVGLSSAEAAERHWIGGMGYGNGWTETVAHDFRFDGSGPVTLAYDYETDTESGFDFVFVLLEKDGVETTLAVYDGTRAGNATHDLSPLLGTTPSDYRIKIRLRSDTAYSDEDGNFVTAIAPFVMDEVTVSGGGEDHHADFETHRDGWYQPDEPQDNPLSEFWLVENRQALGYDRNLHGTGLVVYHVDQEVMSSLNRNNGGSTDQVTRGVVVEEADGRGDLLMGTGGNRGDSSDPWPGSADVFEFSALSTPAACSNDGDSTAVAVEGIEVIGNVVRARFVAGNAAPSFDAVTPADLPQGTTAAVLDLIGAECVRPGAVVRLVREGSADIVASRVVWLDEDLVQAEFEFGLADAGLRDVVLENPDGQTAVVEFGFRVSNEATAVDPIPDRPVGWALQQNHPNPFNPRTTIRFDVPKAGRVSLEIFDARGRRVRTLADRDFDAGFHQVEWTGRDDGGRSVASGVYFVRMQGEDFTARRKMLLAR